jgi:tetratricopeptide (TPR) repeat protein
MSPRVRARSAAFAGLLLLGPALPLGCKGAAPLPPRASELNRAGVEALESGDLETADARFALALEYSPRFVEALTNLGLVELQRGNFARARQLLQRARRLNPDVAQPHHGLGLLAERENRRDEASEHYREALRIDPGFFAARANLARLLFEAGELEHALVELRRLVEAAPKEPLSHTLLAETLLRLGRIPEAESVIGKARESLGDVPSLALLDARSHLRRGDFEGAIDLLAPWAHERSDYGAAALAWMAVAELASGRPRHAVAAAHRALSLDPQSPVATFALAKALDKLHDPAAARWLEHAQKLAPGQDFRLRAREQIRGE